MSLNPPIEPKSRSFLPFALPAVLFAVFLVIGLLPLPSGIVLGLSVALVGQLITVGLMWWSQPSLFRPLLGEFKWKDLFVGIGWGANLYLILLMASIVMVASGVELEASDTSSSIRESPSFMWLVPFVVIATPLVEELFFRGVLANSIRKAGFTALTSIVYSGVVFGLFHSQGLSTASDLVVPLWVTVNGMILAFLSYRRNNIWVSVVAHSMYNLLTILSMIF